jgi:hypothetical protein
MDENFEQLENALRRLKKPIPSENLKAAMKQSMLSQIQNAQNDPLVNQGDSYLYPSLNKLRNYIRKLARSVEPSPVFRSKIKEGVLAFAEKTSLGSNFVWGFARNWQKVLSGFLIAVISLASFTIYIADIPVTKAAKSTSFQEVFGDVEVLREGEVIDAYSTMALKQGDIVVTGDNGIAVIRYIDDSINRLSPESELRIRKLYQDEDKETKTEIVVELDYGRVWSQVVNLVGDESSFNVVSDDVTTTASKSATFDIQNNKRQANVEVSVFKNKVEVVLPDNKQDKTQLILEGYVLAVGKTSPKVEKIALNTEEDELWVQINKAKDKEYKKEVEKEKIEETKKEAGLLPKDLLYTAKKINESTKLLVTLNENDKYKLKVDIAMKRLAEASVLLSEGQGEDANGLIEEFSSLIEEISSEVGNSDELRDYIQDLIEKKEKDLSIVLPDMPRYPAKQALRDAKMKLAIETGETKEVTLEEVTEKINEAKDLIEEDKEDIAVKTLIEVKEEVIGIYRTDDQEPESEEDVIDAQVETLTTAKVLKEVIKEEDVSAEIRKLVIVSHELLKQDLEETVTESTEEISTEVLEKADSVLTDPVKELITGEEEVVVESDFAVIMSITETTIRLQSGLE